MQLSGIVIIWEGEALLDIKLCLPSNLDIVQINGVKMASWFFSDLQ